MEEAGHFGRFGRSGPSGARKHIVCLTIFQLEGGKCREVWGKNWVVHQDLAKGGRDGGKNASLDLCLAKKSGEGWDRWAPPEKEEGSRRLVINASSRHR